MLKPAARLRHRTLAAVLAALLAAPAVAIGTASAAQADAVRQQELWVLNAINVAGAWQHTHGLGVTVALIDSGVNGQVSDLAGSVKTGRDFSGVNTPQSNANWGIHGTWMASLIVGHGHASGGSSGIMGVAPAATVLSIRAVTDQGDPGYRRYQHEPESRVQDHLAAAIRYATSKNVSVISMSLGYQGPSLAVRKAISAALKRGIVVVASSGNSGSTSRARHGNAPYSFPADYPGVLGVGAVGQNGLPAGFSSDNLSVQVAAPGVRVPAQGRDGQYWLVSGTSPACALTAGVAALIKSLHPTLAPSLVVQAITASTSNKPPGGYDEQVGYGTVDAAAALRMAGRLARYRGTGHGLVATARFGGTAAIPAVPVTPRGKRQLVTDLIVALLCLAAVLLIAFRLVVTRRAAVAAAPVGPGPPGAGVSSGLGPPGAGVSPGLGPPGAGVSPGLGPPGAGVSPGLGPPGAGASGAAWTGPGPSGYGNSADHNPAVGYPEQPGHGTPDAYATPDAYGTPAGYQPSAGEQPGGRYAPPATGRPDGSYAPPAAERPDGSCAPPPRAGSPGSYRPPGNASPDGQAALASHGSLAGYHPPEAHDPPDTCGSTDGQAATDGRSPLDGPGPPAVHGPLDSPGPPGAHGPLDGPGPPAVHGPLDGPGPPAVHGPLDGPGPPAVHGSLDAGGSPDGSQTPEPDRHDMSSGPSADYGFPAGYRPAARSGPEPSDQPPTAFRRPGVPQAQSSFPGGASTAPLSAYQPEEPSAPPIDTEEDPPAVDDDTWPPPADLAAGPQAVDDDTWPPPDPW